MKILMKKNITSDFTDIVREIIITHFPSDFNVIFGY